MCGHLPSSSISPKAAACSTASKFSGPSNYQIRGTTPFQSSKRYVQGSNASQHTPNSFLNSSLVQSRKAEKYHVCPLQSRSGHRQASAREENPSVYANSPRNSALRTGGHLRRSFECQCKTLESF